MKILLVCDRSGGHVFPALILAREIKLTKDQAVFYAPSSFLKKYLYEEGFRVYGKPVKLPTFFLKMVYSFFESITLLFILRPKQVIGFGGRESIAMLLAAKLLGVKTSLYEPNKKIGKANQLLSFFVNQIFVGFEQVRGFTKNTAKKIKVVGIPTRTWGKNYTAQEARAAIGFDDKPVIFCFGGSQGSRFINHVFLELLKHFPDDLQVIHLTGKEEYVEVLNKYNTIRKKNIVKDFSPAMEIFYRAADLIISRAGAFTLGEIVHFQIPAILVPHPAASAHQRENAQYLSSRNAAVTILQEEFNFSQFVDKASAIIYQKETANKLKENLSNIGLKTTPQEFYLNFYNSWCS